MAMEPLHLAFRLMVLRGILILTVTVVPLPTSVSMVHLVGIALHVGQPHAGTEAQLTGSLRRRWR